MIRIWLKLLQNYGGEIAEIMQCSQKWCRKLCEVGFEFIDRVGWAHIKNA